MICLRSFLRWSSSPSISKCILLTSVVIISMGNQACCQPEQNIYPRNYHHFQPDFNQIDTPLRNVSRIGDTPPDQYLLIQQCPEPLLETKIVLLLQESGVSKIREQNREQGVFDPSWYRFKRSGDIYRGEWKHNKPQGYGLMCFRTGSVYEGDFLEGIPFGKGKLVTRKGEKYEGEIKYGRANGEGIYKDGSYFYQGQFKDDRKHGQGIEMEEGKYKFVGFFNNGDKVKGILKYENNVYEGEFSENAFHGKGVLTTLDGDQYTGDFKGGEFEGIGQYKWRNGSIYRGNYLAGKPSGLGEFLNHKDGTTSKGIWENALLNGEGSYTDRKGRTTRCIWTNGVMKSIQTN